MSPFQSISIAPIKPRLLAAGANVERVYTISAVEQPDGEDRPPEIPRDLSLIEQEMLQYDARLLIIDPLMAFLCGPDANKDREIRRVLYRLGKIAERCRCTTVCQRHLNKRPGGKAIYRGNASIGVIGQGTIARDAI